MLKIMMSSLNDTTLIRDRIIEIRSALFFNEGRTPTVYSAGIISALEVNTEGQIFFFVNRPDHLLSEDYRFPARLEFYRKGKPFFIKVNGVAEIISDTTQVERYATVYGFKPYSTKNTRALVKVTVQQAECNAPENALDVAVFKKMYQHFVGWFSLLRSFNFSNG